MRRLLKIVLILVVLALSLINQENPFPKQYLTTILVKIGHAVSEKKIKYVQTDNDQAFIAIYHPAPDDLLMETYTSNSFCSVGSASRSSTRPGLKRLLSSLIRTCLSVLQGTSTST